MRSSDLEYSPSSRVDDIGIYLRGYADRSREVRRSLPFETLRYGDGPRQEVDLFGTPGGRVHVFIHGGYWQQLSKDDMSYLAPPFVAAGISFVSVGYDLTPAVDLPTICAQVVGAVEFIRAELQPEELVVGGFSAGAHLAAWVEAAGAQVDKLVLLSGVFDLRPLVDTYVNDVVGMDVDTAAEYSPMLRVPAEPVSTVITWGDNETDAFKQQSRDYAALRRSAGGEVDVFETAGRNHFDLPDDLFELS